MKWQESIRNFTFKRTNGAAQRQNLVGEDAAQTVCLFQREKKSLDNIQELAIPIATDCESNVLMYYHSYWLKESISFW